VLPVSIYSFGPNAKSNTFTGAIGFNATKADGVTEAGRASHPNDQSGYTPPIVRSLVVGDRLFTVSTAGVLASDLTTFANRGFAAFPQVQQAPSGTGVAAPARPVSPSPQ
jgi:hypothetical protein